jgi:UDP-3-O-[3-hydroxymyristoyl] glucosamine N-acyltransferase
MPDPQFFHRAGPFRLADIASLIGAEPPTAAMGDLLVHDIAPLEAAAPGEISVLTDARHVEALALTRAGVIVTNHDLARHANDRRNLVFVAQPRLAYAQIGHLFYPAPPPIAGIDVLARVHPSATIGEGSQIDPGAVIGQRVAIGARCRIGSNVVLGDGVRIGDDCRIGANTTISHALVGARVTVETGVSIGAQGFGFVPGPAGLLRMLQLGRVIIEDDVEIGANCAIDRGATEDTVLGAGTVLDNLVHIGHNVRIGRHCVICGQVGIAGSSVVGDGVMMGGQVGIGDHLTIGAGARIAAKSGVMRDIEPGATVGGFPAMAIKHWHRQTAGLARRFQRREEKRD